MIGSEQYQPGAEFGGGRFKIIRKLGEGGMGIVCLADDTMLHETIAVKFLSPQLGHDNEAMDDMRRETRKSRQLSHRNIIRIHDIYHLPSEVPFITMEYIQGQSLSSLKADQIDRIFPWPFLVPIVAQLCDALDYAHEEKIVHRDLKPANMMLDPKGRLNLADFGLAATISDSMVKVTKDMGVSGTPTYMSPQQLAGKPSKVTDDIYSVGATLYELLTSKPPFYKGNVLDQIKEVDPPTIQERLQELGLENEVPDAVAFTIMACLNKDPAKRPQSAGEAAALMGIAPGSSRQASSGGSSKAVPLDSPEASEMLSKLDLDRPTKEKPKFRWLDPPKISPAVEPEPVEPSPSAEVKEPPPTVASTSPPAPQGETPAPPGRSRWTFAEHQARLAAVEAPTEPEVDTAPMDATSGPTGSSKGKLYGIIGGVVVVLIIILAVAFRTWKPPEATPPPAVEAASDVTKPAAPPVATVVVNPANTTPTKSPRWTNTLGMVFVPVPGTDVQFCIWDTRVQDYAAFARAKNRAVTQPRFAQGPTHPVVMVSWPDANEFAQWLTQRERQSRKRTAAQNYRLPKDWEWSVAAGLNEPRTGRPQVKSGRIANVYPWGTQWPPPKGAGNFDASLGVDSYVNTSPVGSFAPNPFGLYDMGGNVCQWCEDFSNGPATGRVLRGGAWNLSAPAQLLSSTRFSNSRSSLGLDYGFRLVLEGTSAK